MKYSNYSEFDDHIPSELLNVQFEREVFGEREISINEQLISFHQFLQRKRAMLFCKLYGALRSK